MDIDLRVALFFIAFLRAKMEGDLRKRLGVALLLPVVLIIGVLFGNRLDGPRKRLDGLVLSTLLVLSRDFTGLVVR